MKTFALAFVAMVAAKHHHNEHQEVQLMEKPPTVGLGSRFIPWNREDYDNGKELWKGDWAKYRAAHPNDQDCSISESDNWKGAQQCSQSWECRGARMCERGGWCSGYDGCEGTPLPDQAPGLSVDN